MEKKWTDEEFNIFRLKILTNCQIKIEKVIYDYKMYIPKDCQLLKEQLEKDLLEDEKFVTNYNKVVTNSSLDFGRHIPVKNDMIHILINIIKVAFNNNFMESIDLSYLVNLRMVKFGFNYNRNDYVLPPTVRLLIFGPGFKQPLINLPRDLQQITVSKTYPFVDHVGIPKKVKIIYVEDLFYY